jgi:hypothetical protein
MPECFSTPTREVWFDSLEGVLAWAASLGTPEAEAAVEFLEHHVFLHVERDVVTNKISEIEQKYNIDLRMDYEQVTNICLLIQERMYYRQELLNPLVEDVIEENIFQHSSYFRTFRWDPPVDWGELSIRETPRRLERACKLYNKWMEDVDTNPRKQKLLAYWIKIELDFISNMNRRKERIRWKMQKINHQRNNKTP